MKNFLPLLLILLLVSCQIEDDQSPRPDEAFIKYFGALTSYEAADIEIEYDATGTEALGLVVFGSKTSDSGDKDYFVLRADPDGNLIDSVSFGLTSLDLDQDGNADDFDGDTFGDQFVGEDQAGQIHFVPDFGDGSSGFAIVGTSSVRINNGNVTDADWRILTFGLLNADLSFRTIVGDSLLTFGAISATQTPLDFEGNDVIRLSNGNFLIGGSREVERSPGFIDADNYFLSINQNAEIQFAINRGTTRADQLIRVFEKEDGNLAMIGQTRYPSSLGENGGNTGVNVLYLETDQNGTEVDRQAYGVDDSRDLADGTVYDDFVSDAIQTLNGFAVVGTSETNQNDSYAFVMTLTSEGTHSFNGAHHFSDFNPEGVTLESLGLGVTETLDNKIIMVGQYLSFETETGSRGGEGMFVKYSQGATQFPGNEAFFGLSDGNDRIVDAVTLPDGKIAAVANVDFGGTVQLISIMKLNADGTLE